jgi:hypothetical protein
MKLELYHFYNFRGEPDRVLQYVGQENGWYQFEKLGTLGVWCELLDEDLGLIELSIDMRDGR